MPIITTVGRCLPLCLWAAVPCMAVPRVGVAVWGIIILGK
jgi:hypothetical protein